MVMDYGNLLIGCLLKKESILLKFFKIISMMSSLLINNKMLVSLNIWVVAGIKSVLPKHKILESAV